MDRPLPRRRHPDPDIRLVYLPSRAEHAAGFAEGGSGLAMEIGWIRGECALTAR
jgi:hypothetical protein